MAQLFAEQLRDHGVSANATERAARGQSRINLKTGIYRSAARGQSRYVRDHWRRIQREMRAGGLQPNPGKAKIVETRRAVVAGYHGAAEALLQAGQADLAQKILGFVERNESPSYRRRAPRRGGRAQVAGTTDRSSSGVLSVSQSIVVVAG